MRFEVIFVLSIVNFARAYPPPYISDPSLPSLPIERRDTSVIFSVVSATFGLSRKPLPSRFGETPDEHRMVTRNPDRISFMENANGPFVEASTRKNERIELQNDDSNRKKTYEVAYVSAPPQDPYPDYVKTPNDQNSQIYSYGDYTNQEIPANSQGTKEKYDTSRYHNEDSYKNPQIYDSLYVNSQQPVSQVTQARNNSLENVRTQSEDYKKPLSSYDETYKYPKPQDPKESSNTVGVQYDSGFRIQQTYTTDVPQYSHDKVTSGSHGTRDHSENTNKEIYRFPDTQNTAFNQNFGEVNHNQKISGDKQQLLHYPDHDPVLSPNQKITINIEYPTENYSNSVYTTRAPLKRPVISRTTSKSPNDSSRVKA